MPPFIHSNEESEIPEDVVLSAETLEETFQSMFTEEQAFMRANSHLRVTPGVSILTRDLYGSRGDGGTSGLRQLHTYGIDGDYTRNEQPVAPNGDTVDSPGSNEKPKKLSTAHINRLRKAAEVIILELNGRVPNTSTSAGRRERQYLELLRNEKDANLTTEEVIRSEFPIHLINVSAQLFRKIAESGDVMGIRLAPSEYGRKYVFGCGTCGIEIPDDCAFLCSGSMWCSEHVPQLEVCAGCSNLRATCTQVQTFDNRDVMMCEHCLRVRTSCSRCGENITREYIELMLCQSCIDYTDDSDIHRHFSLGMKWTGTAKGDIVKSDRLFSAEVEAVVPTSSMMHHLSKDLPHENGISGDGSIDSEGGYGFETQTPRLQGKRGEELVHRMAKVFKDTSAFVNKSCGLHVHLDGKGIMRPSRKEYPTALIQLWKTHLVFEDAILSFLPYERRRNGFCRPMGDSFKLTELELCDSLLDLEKLWYKQRTYSEIQRSKGQHYHSSRYFGVNFHSLLSHGHLEIRYHSGTLNARKILEWANLHCLIMDSAAKKELTDDFLQEAMATSVLRDKTELLFETIGMAESSRQYFRARQKKFGSKSADESVKLPDGSVTQ